MIGVSSRELQSTESSLISKLLVRMNLLLGVESKISLNHLVIDKSLT